MRFGDLSRPVNRGDLESVIFGLICGGLTSFFWTVHPYATAAVLFCALLIYPFCVVLHELGHAWAASLVGGKVRYIQLGKPKGDSSPRQFSWLGYRWQFYALPFSGRVLSDLLTSHRFRLRRCCFIAGGPATNLILLVSAASWVERTQNQTFNTVLVALILTNALILFYTVLPRTYPSGSAARSSDGRLFLNTLRYTNAEIETMVAQSRVAARFLDDVQQLEALSLPELFVKHDLSPDNLAVLSSITDRLLLLNDPRYGDYAPKLIHHPQLSKAYRPYAIDNYLTWQLHSGPPADPESALSLSMQLLEASDTASTRGTRGAVLVDTGHCAEGKAMLEDVLKKTSSATDRVYTHVFLAIAAAKEGDLESARRHAQAAAKIAPDSPVLTRVSDLLTGESGLIPTTPQPGPIEA